MKKKTLLPRSNTTKCVRRGEGKGGKRGGETERDTERKKRRKRGRKNLSLRKFNRAMF